ncbi:putative nucleotidyltransferase substrate binding domain-containing protein [Azohydromonas aeria]|uniref:putative nucleotidyltransferase substrate binding domain-containing protein n=1 Tax=Azohydromonas aeria TaxID=2590212 RepID=UPI0012FA05F0|nr:putative nucleotidyltransferase substrate binding domain-containing protein [Azohydromonas aeria]
MPSACLPEPSLSELLGRHRVFSLLDAASQARLARRLACRRFEAGERVAADAALGRRLGWVLCGRVALLREGGAADVATLEGGELFGAGALPRGEPQGWTAVARERTDIAFLPAADVAQLCAEHPAMALFLAPPPAGNGAGGSAAERGSDPHLGLMAQPVRGLLKRAPVTLAPHASILQAAQTMRDERVSSVLLLEQEHLFGLVTDRDLRNRVLAAGLDPQEPVHRVATVAPLAVDVAQPAFEALLLMARHNIHHVPVLDGTRVVGMLTATDITEQHSTSAVYLAGEVHKQTTLQGLVEVAGRVKALQRNLAAAQASACSTGHIVTAVTDAVTTRLLQMAEAQLGPAPVDYAWVAAGSQARSEQTARSDQDNCLVLDDRYDEAAHGAYFRALAAFVNDGLNACGYVHCPGEMMARTDEWRQPQWRWAEYFRRWTEEPEPRALMLTCVFFDLRAIHGRAELLDSLRAQVLRQTQGNRIFLAYMVGNALKHRPPLSLFGGIATVRAGKLRDAVDLKHSGIVPIVDLARIYALAGGHEAVNTYARLEVAAQSGEISEQSARDLRDALEFMAGLRIRHQAQQTRQGQAADNMLSLSELSNFERSQLKDAFAVVQTLQSVLAQRYR